MAEFLFITPKEITSTTIMGGNVDADKYKFCIADVQLTVIEPMLGTELYDKIAAEAEADTLAGDYLTLYNEYVKPITKHMAMSEYLEIAPYMVANGGVFKSSPENFEVVDIEEVKTLSKRWAGYAQAMVLRFEKWICKNPLTEYKTCQDDVNASKKLSLAGGWYLPGVTPKSDNDLDCG